MRNFSELPASGVVILDARPVRAQAFGRGRRIEVHHHADLGERHPDAAQRGDEAGPPELDHLVRAVARRLVDVGGLEQSQLVVEAQRLGREP